MADAHTLHTALLRPAILHILRAQGFHSTRPSVLDTLTDLAARHLLLIADRTAYFAYDRTCADPHAPLPPLPGLESDTTTTSTATRADADALAPTLADVRHALESTYFFPTAVTPGEEAWREVLRKPLSAYPAGAAREKERRRRDADDTRDVRDFVDWATGPVNREIRRIAGVLDDEAEANPSDGAVGGALDGGLADAGAGDGQGRDKGSAEDDAKDAALKGLQPQAVARVGKDDYVAALKKKHSKTGDGARYAGTALGKLGEEKGTVRIEGGPETLEAWSRGVKRKQVDPAG